MNENYKLSVVASVYNEEKNILEFYSRIDGEIKKLPNVEMELIFVDDGSSDGSFGIMNEIVKSDGRVKIIRFSRNFGHEAAMLAGVDNASGDAVICMDSDLQHPPECVPTILKTFEDGNEIVNMVGSDKPVTSRLFYKFLNVITSVKLEENASDFFLISKKAAEILRSEYREQARFLRGFIQIIGFKKTALNYESRPRFGGKSKYNAKKLFSLSVNALASFSNVPLRVGIFAGCLTGLFSIAVAVYSIVVRYLRGAPPGYTTIVILLCVLFSINFFVIGIIGEYIGHILYEVKKRPLYIVSEIIGGASRSQDK